MNPTPHFYPNRFPKCWVHWGPGGKRSFHLQCRARLADLNINIWRFPAGCTAKRRKHSYRTPSISQGYHYSLNTCTSKNPITETF